MRYFLGVDVGGTKTHTVLADETGRVVGFGLSGPGNHQGVGFDGMYEALFSGFSQALKMSGLTAGDISGAGFGIAGYDWPSERSMMEATIRRLGIACPIHMVNDAVPGLVAGARDGWGVGLVSGTGCNCRGWDREHQREGRVTGYGYQMGENAGASELVWRAMQMVSFEWTRRGPATALTPALIQYAGASDMEDLLESYTEGRRYVGAQAAPLVFEVAARGDPVAQDVIRWAGVELGEMANAVIRQLGFETLTFDVVLAGSMFEGGPMLIEPLRETIHAVAPGAHLVRLSVPPVIGAVIIGMESGHHQATAEIRARLRDSLATFQSAEIDS